MAAVGGKRGGTAWRPTGTKHRAAARWAWVHTRKGAAPVAIAPAAAGPAPSPAMAPVSSTSTSSSPSTSAAVTAATATGGALGDGRGVSKANGQRTVPACAAAAEVGAADQTDAAGVRLSSSSWGRDRLRSCEEAVASTPGTPAAATFQANGTAVVAQAPGTCVVAPHRPQTTGTDRAGGGPLGTVDSALTSGAGAAVAVATAAAASGRVRARMGCGVYPCATHHSATCSTVTKSGSVPANALVASAADGSVWGCVRSSRRNSFRSALARDRWPPPPPTPTPCQTDRLQARDMRVWVQASAHLELLAAWRGPLQEGRDGRCARKR
jgi:hypothetical protein